MPALGGLEDTAMAITVDPVCDELVDEAAAATQGLVCMHRYHRYCFCSLACQRQFERNRDAYVMTRDVVCGREVDPSDADLRDLCRFHEGRRLRFCSRDCLAQFAQDPAHFTNGHPHPDASAHPRHAGP